jgi:hypothetical protein
MGIEREGVFLPLINKRLEYARINCCRAINKKLWGGGVPNCL